MSDETLETKPSIQPQNTMLVVEVQEERKAWPQHRCFEPSKSGELIRNPTWYDRVYERTTSQPMRRTLQSGIDRAKALIASALLGALLAGCSSSLYTDRRETISPLAGDALMTNRVTQTIDPWSPASANRNIAFSGEKMQTASERYRTGRVIPPVNATTSSLTYSQAAQAAQSAASSQQSSAPNSSSSSSIK